MKRRDDNMLRGLGWLAACCALLITAPPATGQVVTELREIRADGTLGDVVDPPERAFRPHEKHLKHAIELSRDLSGSIRARIHVDEQGRVVSHRTTLDGHGKVRMALNFGYRVQDLLEAWTFAPGAARQLEATIEVAPIGAPVASESASLDGLRAWLRRIEHWEIAESSTTSCLPCMAWIAFEARSRAVAATLDDATELFGPMTQSANPLVAAVAEWRVADAEGRPIDEALRARATGDTPCVDTMVFRRAVDQAPQRVRGASVADMGALSDALARADAGARAMRPTSILDGVAFSSIGNGSDHIWGTAYFERTGSEWRLLCQ